ncbi:putative period circadian protein [Exophiala viscosa]|uniref:putative period circadian protein n=1 Tax=Exophiala viscosa TaxID=2486360 RepID=UPI002195CEF4|nr:putative period circadian protein [Exophiala viscosa]
MSNLINKAKVAFAEHKAEKNTGTTGYGGTQTTDYSTGQTGTGYGHHAGTTGTTTTAGPHNSSVMNKADPRVDSDLDHRGNPTSHIGGHGTSHTTGGYGTGVGTTGASTTAGPHNSSALNKADPRIDSDLDHRGNPTSHVGGHGTSHTTTGYGTGAGTTGTTTTGTSASAGPHNSKLLNKLDPRVDSDLDHRGNPTSAAGGYSQGAGYGAAGATGITGTTGTGHHSHHHGHGHHGQAPIHDQTTTGHTGVGSHTGYGGNSGTTGLGGNSGTTGLGGNSGTTGYGGNTSTTTGTQPVHNSNLLNKLDPRVKTDSNGNAY